MDVLTPHCSMPDACDAVPQANSSDTLECVITPLLLRWRRYCHFDNEDLSISHRGNVAVCDISVETDTSLIRNHWKCLVTFTKLSTCRRGDKIRTSVSLVDNEAVSESVCAAWLYDDSHWWRYGEIAITCVILLLLMVKSMTGSVTERAKACARKWEKIVWRTRRRLADQQRLRFNVWL